MSGHTIVRIAATEPPRLIGVPHATTDAAWAFWLSIGLFGALAILSAVLAVVFWRHRALTRDPASFAFRALARRLGVRRSERTALRRLGESQGIPAAALLISPSVLREAIETARAEPDLSPDLPAIGRLSERLAGV